MVKTVQVTVIAIVYMAINTVTRSMDTVYMDARKDGKNHCVIKVINL